MGLTSFSIDLVKKYLPVYSVMELGAQNLFDLEYMGNNPFASTFYLKNGVKDYACIDLNGENRAYRFDLSKPQRDFLQYDLVTDFGTSEHVCNEGRFDWEAIYNCWVTKHNLCKDGGLIISENPESGSWINGKVISHFSYQFYTEHFYRQLAALTRYELVELGRHAAMGNETDGWNVYCVLRKKGSKFITLKDFKTLDLRQS